MLIPARHVRRCIIFGVAAACAVRAVGQISTSNFRVGVLAVVKPREKFELFAPLQGLGYIEGRNMVVDYQFAEGRPDRLPSLAATLVGHGVDVIVAIGNREVLAAKAATTSIPIVMMYAGAPVETGLVTSLARPGGNVTGTTSQAPDISGKILQVLREVLPIVGRVAVLIEVDHPAMAPYIRALDEAASKMRIQLDYLFGRSVEEMEASLGAIQRSRPDALYAVTTGVLWANRARIIAFAARERLPAIYVYREPVYEGGLMAYAQDDLAIARRTAAIVDRILRGTSPAEIPVEQPTKYDLVINAKAARAIGLAVPAAVLVRATEVIE